MKRRYWTLGLMVLVLLGGCIGGKERKVSGTVTWNDEPIKEGHINFIELDGNGAISGKIVNGKYEVMCLPGTKRVEIYATRATTDKIDPAMGMAPREMYIPERFNARTQLTSEVSTSENRFDFHLKEEP
ncbi:MAG: hypothetical protein K2R98_29885 [Gemmataceae bacterium]|nr:hypothetical protein [Gemmataceae bacterium]